MCFDPLTMAGTAAAGGAILSGVGAFQQNQALNDQANGVQDAADIQIKQLGDQKNQTLEQRNIEAMQARARLLAVTADAGTGYGGTYTGLDRAIQGSLGRATKAINTNYENNVKAVQIGASNSISALDSQQQNIGLSALQGGLGGASAGLQVYSGLNQVYAPQPSRGYYGTGTVDNPNRPWWLK